MSDRNEFGILVRVVVRRQLAMVKRLGNNTLSASESKFVERLRLRLENGLPLEPEQERKMSDIFSRFSTVRLGTGGTGSNADRFQKLCR
jgi:hypothetical protein